MRAWYHVAGNEMVSGMNGYLAGQIPWRTRMRRVGVLIALLPPLMLSGYYGAEPNKKQRVTPTPEELRKTLVEMLRFQEQFLQLHGSMSREREVTMDYIIAWDLLDSSGLCCAWIENLLDLLEMYNLIDNEADKVKCRVLIIFKSNVIKENLKNHLKIINNATNDTEKPGVAISSRDFAKMISEVISKIEKLSFN
jgi:hypothetical protein